MYLRKKDLHYFLEPNVESPKHHSNYVLRRVDQLLKILGLQISVVMVLVMHSSQTVCWSAQSQSYETQCVIRTTGKRAETPSSIEIISAGMKGLKKT